MTHQVLLIVVLAAGLAAETLALPSRASEPAAPYPSPLAGAKELGRPVTYTETKIPLGELVQRVAAATA